MISHMFFCFVLKINATPSSWEYFKEELACGRPSKSEARTFDILDNAPQQQQQLCSFDVLGHISPAV